MHDEMRFALQAFRVGNLDAAETAARKALRIEPGELRMTRVLTDLLARTGRPHDALFYLREAVRLHPKDLLVRYRLAECSFGLGRLQESERAARKVLDLLARDRALVRGQRRELTVRLGDLLMEIKRRGGVRTGATQAASPGASRNAAAGGKGAEAREARTDRAESESAAPAHPPRSEAGDAFPAAPLTFEGEDGVSPAAAAPAWMEDPWSDDLEERDLLLEAQRTSFLAQYEELLCLDALQGVRRLEYQVETARKILRRLGGRALLCDEVGLGKTIEAGMVIKEYLLRGLARRVLILAPPGLVHQWREEMTSKFGLGFESWGDGETSGPGGGPELFIASIATARRERSLRLLAAEEWDVVVVDEAHHVRRRSSRSWALVNLLRKRFLLLLSATPVHSDLMELYELATLARPGLLGSPAEFRRRHMTGRGGRKAADPEGLREALGEVMVRNTRAHADVALPRRFATTLLLPPLPGEERAYRAASECVRLLYPAAPPSWRMRLRHLLGAAGSGPRAVRGAAARWLSGPDWTAGPPDAAVAGDPATNPGFAGETRAAAQALLGEVVSAAQSGASAKAERLVRMVSDTTEQVVVFCRYRTTLLDLAGGLSAAGIDPVVYHGGLRRSEKDQVIERFRSGARVLLSTESGGEGRNIQFCRTIVNYDLPWDPMLIEQRIGRLHRIGQERDVFIFNFVLAGTVEEELLRILDEKIHLFELIVGEVDSVLGNLDRGEDFAGIVLDLWAGARDDAERRARFESFGEELARARAAYQRQKAVEDSLFADGLEV